MFGPPERLVRDGEVIFRVSVTAPPMGIRLESAGGQIVCDLSVQPKFVALQSKILSELVKERSLFRNPPSVESLAAITPNWGFVTVSGKVQVSPYTAIDASGIRQPCIVDLQLTQVEISRTTIRPIFIMVYVGPVGAGIIDFEWSAGKTGADELEEISDVPNAAEEGTFTLMDPAIKEREKAAAKAVVKAAFVAAEEARAHAEKLADDFEAKYDLSDSESAFSEWLSEDEDD